jgi:hypothetical protein
MTSEEIPAASRVRVLTIGTTAVLGITGFVLSIIDVVRGHWDHDAGFYFLHSWFVSLGYRPYVDYVSIYPPMMEIMTAVPMWMGISHTVLAVAVPIAWILANSLAIGWLAYSVSGVRSAGFFAAALFPFFSIDNGGNHLTLEHGVIFFTALAIIAAQRSSMFVSGLCAAAALLWKQNGIFVFLPLAVFFWERRKELRPRSFVRFASGLIAPFIAILAWLRFDLHALIQNAREFTGYAQEKAAFDAKWILEEWWRSQFTTVFWVLLCIAFVGLLASSRHRLLALACAIPIAMNLLARCYRNYPHYDLNVWPYVVMLLSLAFIELKRRSGAAAFAGGIVAALGLFAAFFTQYDPIVIWAGKDRLRENFLPAVQEIRRLDPSGRARIRQYGNEGMIEFLSERLPEDLYISYKRLPPDYLGQGVYDDHPPHERIVAIVDLGQDWVRETRKVLVAQGWRVTGRFGDREFAIETLVFGGNGRPAAMP